MLLLFIFVSNYFSYTAIPNHAPTVQVATYLTTYFHIQNSIHISQIVLQFYTFWGLFWEI